MKLYFGRSPKPLEGHLLVDVAPNPSVDLIHDLNDLPWPWDADSIQRIVAADLVEHLRLSLLEFCDEAWRVLKPGGELFVRTPHHDGAESWIDPTHRWHLHEQSFHYLDPESLRGKNNVHSASHPWRILSLGVRNRSQIHALLTPRK
jgi:SAM-dependent methyltransferase